MNSLAPRPPLAYHIGFPEDAQARAEKFFLCAPPRLRKYVKCVLHMSAGYHGTWFCVADAGWWVWNTQRAVFVSFEDALPFAGKRELAAGLRASKAKKWEPRSVQSRKGGRLATD